MRLLRVLAIAGLLAPVPYTAGADVVVLDFERLGDVEPVLDFYNGGLGGSGSGPGPDFGIRFTENALALIDQDAGGSGNFANEPSPNTTMFFLSGTAVMNVDEGFTTGFSFFYTALSQPGTVVVYSGPNATGNVLANLALPVTGGTCGGDPTGEFNCWAPFGVSFAGTGLSVDFGGTVNQIGFDNITLGSAAPGNPIPEPGTLVLVASAAAAAAGRKFWRRHRA